MEKFFRVYTIDFYIGKIVEKNGRRVVDYSEGETISATYPLTAEFSIGRSVSAYVNSAQINIYGLDETKRNLLKKDRVLDQNKYIKMIVNAGFTEATSTLYIGAINECYSVRQGGETEYRTVIDASDSVIDVYESQTNQSFASDTNPQTIVRNISNDLAELQLGGVSPTLNIPVPKRGSIYNGKTLDVLRDLKDSSMIVDNGYIYLMDLEKDVNASLGTLYVDCDYGLLGTPRRRNNYLSCDLIFEPAASLCQYCELKSSTDLSLNTGYKIMGVSHNGTISGSKDGSMTTTLDLYVGLGGFNYITFG